MTQPLTHQPNAPVLDTMYLALEDPESWEILYAEPIPGVKRDGSEVVCSRVVTISVMDAIDHQRYVNLQMKPKSSLMARDLLDEFIIVNWATLRKINIEVDEDTVVLNLNHPLAGKTLNFDVEVVEIN